MKTRAECDTEAGLPIFPMRSTPTHMWYFYSEGEVAAKIPSSEYKLVNDARKRYPANEKIAVIDVEYDAKVAEWQEFSKTAMRIWHSSLREEYGHLSDDVFNLCYDKAYERGHSSGMDEVANYMIDIADFAEKIISASKVDE